MQPQHDITQLLGRVAVGDRSAADELLPLVYRELRTLADTEDRILATEMTAAWCLAWP